MFATDTSAAAITNANNLDERLINIVDELRAERARVGLRALALAPTLDLYHALLRGEAVPLELLNPVAVARYGLRR